MKYIVCFLLFSLSYSSLGSTTSTNSKIVFKEKGGNVLIEAESFSKQSRHKVRAWHITTSKLTPKVTPDGDPTHLKGASRGAYVEILPDTKRRTHEPSVIDVNYSLTPGRLGVLSYPVQFKTPGRYYLWVRGYCTRTGNDDSIHLGINGTWPESGKNVFWNTPEGWHWTSHRMTQSGSDFGKTYLDVKTPGLHTIQISMREDGAELDQLYLSNKTPDKHKPPKYVPPNWASTATPGPKTVASVKPTPKSAPTPPANILDLPHISVPEAECEIHTREDDGSRIICPNDFPTGKAYHKNNSRHMALNLKVATSADTSVSFPYPTKSYYVSLTYLPETDCKVIHKIKVNGKTVLTCEVPKHTSGALSKLKMKTSEKIRIRRGSTITISTKSLERSGGDHTAGRWELLRFSTR